MAAALAEPANVNSVDVMMGGNSRSRRMRIASAWTLMPTRGVDGLLLDRICGCRLAIGVEMEPSYRSTNAYIDNDDRVVGGRLATHFEEQSPVNVWKFESVHCTLALLLSLSPLDFSRQKDRDLTLPCSQ